MKELTKIKYRMMQALEEVNDEGVFTGDYVCHEDMLEECPKGFDDYFIACSDPDKPVYFILIKKVQP